MVVFLRNRLHYALNYTEVKKIVKQRLIKVDGKVRTHHCFPTGFMDVISIEKTGEHFRLLYDVKGRFVVHAITSEEAKYKLCKVRRVYTGPRGVPLLTTHDGRTIRYPDPLVKTHDTILVDIASGKIRQSIKFEPGNLCMITGGANLGRVGVVTHRERHPGSFDIIYIKDTLGHSFNTRMNNVFIIGKATKAWVSLPKGKGLRLTVAEERDLRLKRKDGRGGASAEAVAPAPAPAAGDSVKERTSSTSAAKERTTSTSKQAAEKGAAPAAEKPAAEPKKAEKAPAPKKAKAAK
jgi:small subunit ribosomal protein S4e